MRLVLRNILPACVTLFFVFVVRLASYEGLAALAGMTEIICACFSAKTKYKLLFTIKILLQYNAADRI